MNDVYNLVFVVHLLSWEIINTCSNKACSPIISIKECGDGIKQLHVYSVCLICRGEEEEEEEAMPRRGMGWRSLERAPLNLLE